MCVALDTRMDEDGYREPLVARRRRVEACVSLISSRNVVHDSLLVSTEFLQSVVVQFYSGCALTIMKGLGESSRTTLKNVPILTIRYPILHDTFHVLLGFDTSLAGELGVWSFVAAQHYSPAYERAALIGRWVTRLLTPWQWKRLHIHEQRGKRLGAKAACIIAQPFELYATSGKVLAHTIGSSLIADQILQRIGIGFKNSTHIGLHLVDKKEKPHFLTKVWLQSLL